jgi:Uma2 family endonuclease
MAPIRQKAMPEIDVVGEDAPSDVQPTELGPMSVSDYLSGPESSEYEELQYGWVVSEGTPSTAHQTVSSAIDRALWAYVTDHRLGFVVGHLDVVLDQKRRLIVAPDLLVVLNERIHIVRERCVWGAPNLAVEILSPSNRANDRQRKLAWYREYGVQEYWIVDPVEFTIEVFDLEAEPSTGPRVYGEADVLESRVIEGFRHPVANFFERAYDYFREGQSFDLPGRPMPPKHT